MIQLRDYQKESLDLTLKAFLKEQYAWVDLATGLGKTILFCTLAMELRKQNPSLRVLILAHRDELLEQAIKKYLKVDSVANIGKLGSGSYSYEHPIIVASIATVARKNNKGIHTHLEKLKMEYGEGGSLLIVIDEMHHSASSQYALVQQTFTRAKYFGCTATPKRLDKKTLFKGIPPVFSMSLLDGILKGYLATLRYHAPKTDITIDEITLKNDPNLSEKDFSPKELEKYINTKKRNHSVVRAYKHYCPEKLAICFGVTINHIKDLEAEFNACGVPAICITADTKNRQEIYAQAKKGIWRVLLTVGVLTEGFDLDATEQEDEIECVILARPTQSEGLYIQMIGRGTRLHPRKKECLLLDMTDNYKRLSLRPVRYQDIVKKEVKDGETVEEAIARHDKEAVLHTLRRRKDVEEGRPHDIYINLFEPIIWEKTEKGYVAQVGAKKHKIGLTQSKNDPTLYNVWFSFGTKDGTYKEARAWTLRQPMEVCQALIEAKVRYLYDGKMDYIDPDAYWRKQKPTREQLFYLLGLGYTGSRPETNGEASDLIEILKIKRDLSRKEA